MSHRSKQMQIIAELSRSSSERYPSSDYQSINPDSGLHQVPLHPKDDPNPFRRFLRRLGLSRHDRYIEDVQHHEETQRFVHHQRAGTQSAKHQTDHRQSVFDMRQTQKTCGVATSTSMVAFLRSFRAMDLLTKKIDKRLSEMEKSVSNPALLETVKREWTLMHEKLLAKHRHDVVGPEINPYEFEDEEFFG